MKSKRTPEWQAPGKRRTTALSLLASAVLLLSIAGGLVLLHSPVHAQNATTTATTPITEFDTFYIDSAGFVYDQWSNSNWTVSEQPPAILDGLPSDTNKLVGTPAAVSDGPGRLNLFAKDTTDISTGGSALIWQNIWSNNSFEENWQQVPGNYQNGVLYLDCGILNSGCTPYAIVSDPTVTSWGPGRMDLFVYARDNSSNLDLLHTWADHSIWSGTWENLGTVAPFGSINAGHPSAVSWGPGRIDVFVHSASNTVDHKWFDNGQWSNGWEDLGGSIKDSPSAVSWLPGFLEVFTRNTSNHLTSELYGGGFWSGWGAPTNFTLNTAPAAVAVPGSTVHVFTTSGQDLLRRTDSPVGNPNGWSSDWVHYSCNCLSPSSYGPTAVVWTYELMEGTNVAPLASASASSENVATGQQASKAIDGVISGADSTREWATSGGGVGNWLQLNWSSPQSVAGIVLYDRPNLNDQITGGTIQLSDGSQLAFANLYNGGDGRILTFSPRTITSLRVNVTAVSGATQNIGLAEIQVYGATLPITGSNIAPAAGLGASSENTSTGQQARKAVDGVIGGYPTDPTHEWATVHGGAGSWISLAWSSLQTVNSVVLYDRPNLNDQITGGTLQFSDGSTVTVGPLSNDGEATVISFAPRTITNVQMTVTSVSDTTVNVGLAEIQVYGTPVPRPSPTSPPEDTPTPRGGCAVTQPGGIGNKAISCP